ncbi:hypothetical protein HDU76_003263, partial [Blyttiomyces sp. JEL0837]
MSSSVTTTTSTFKSASSQLKDSTMIELTSTKSNKPDIINFYIQFPRYAEYHHNRINQIIHIICVPQILGYPFGVNFLFTLSYAVYYILLEPTLGVLIAPFLFALSVGANKFFVYGMESGAYDPNLVASVIHVLCWMAQIFIGHSIAERRAPALFDNLLHALVLAPFFVFCEVLFGLGFKRDLFDKLEAITVKNIEK